MNHKYTRQQIIESIKYWKNVLKTLDESKSPLLDAFAEKFGKNVVFSRQPYVLTNQCAIEIAKILNDVLFDSKIVTFPDIKVLTYGQFCKEYRFCESNYCNKPFYKIICPKNVFFGDHYIVIENDLNTLKPNDNLIYSHEIIFLNLDKLKYRSFIMNAATLCHELIHTYDR